MNAGVETTDHPSIVYYDSDYPSKQFSVYPENFDDIVAFQGLANDVDKYLQLAGLAGPKILDLCCGTGRITLPLAAAGYKVTGVDFCESFIEQLQTKLKTLDEKTTGNVSLVAQDITKLSLKEHQFDLAICGFNSLLCITDHLNQQKALDAIAKHVRKDAVLALDLMNPFILNWAGDPVPKPFFNRRNPHTGNFYTRFAAMGPLLVDQRQKLYGWYDEIVQDGTVKRQVYEIYWRPVFRYEIELMLEKAGFKIKNIYGGHQNEPFTTQSRKMFIEAVKL